MTAIPITAEGLGKKYRLGGSAPYHTLRETLPKLLRRPFQGSTNGSRSKPASQDFWALKDVSFVLEHGEVMGIIGKNGAGKSTLLKILSRITWPTEGRAYIHGRVGSLLEVGTGFHQELAGRENIFLNGAIMGMRKAEIGVQVYVWFSVSGRGKAPTPLRLRLCPQQQQPSEMVAYPR